MAHVDEVRRVMIEKGFPMEKIQFIYSEKIFIDSRDNTVSESDNKNSKGYKCCLLAITTEKSMDDLKARIRKSKMTYIYIIDQAPYFFPSIKDNVFQFIRGVFIQEPIAKL